MNDAPRDLEIAVPFGRGRAIAIAVAALLMGVMIVPELGYVPLWDGRVYANCVLEAAFSGISMESLRCAGHPSQGWGLVLAVPQLFAPGSVAVLHLTNLLLGITAVVAWRVVMARAFPAAEHAVALDLLAIAVAAHPVVLSTLLQPNIDFGVYAFFAMALAGMLSPGRAGTIVAVVAGAFCAFSKETGVVAYAAAVGATLVIEHVRAGGPIRGRWRDIVRRGAALKAPIFLFIAHVLWRNATQGGSAIWRHGWQASAADGFSFFDLSDPVFVSYAAGLGVLGFMWVAWMPVVTDAAVGLARMARRREWRRLEGADATVVAALTVLTLGLTYVLTSFRTWSNVRYFAVLYPLFLVLAYAALVRLGASARVRQGAAAAIAALFVLASYRSVDPLSRAVYGTFDTGERRMYAMSSITGEFDGPGRDQLVYNLEFTGYHHAQNALFATLRPGDSTVIAAPRPVRWNIWTQLDRATGQRTMRRDGVFTPIYADEVDIQARQSRAAWLLQFSNQPDGDRSLDLLRARYRVTDSVTVFARGQRLVARHLVRLEPAVLP